MTLNIEKLEFTFVDCKLGLSARRVWEHTQYLQVNPFASITPTKALIPEDYVDIIEISGPSFTLTDLIFGLACTDFSIASL